MQTATKRSRDDETKRLLNAARARTPSLRLSVPPAAFRTGFSLAELLVVIALIVLILALALPAFNFITGSRSIDGATNVVSAFIGRARAEALDRGRVTGLMFYIDPASQRRGMILVGETGAKYTAAGALVDNPDVDVYLDLLPDREPILLPVGIDLQTIDNGTRNTTTQQLTAPYFDRYLGFNTAIARPSAPQTLAGNARVPFGGVILFDGKGRLVSLKYAFRSSTGDAEATVNLTQMGLFLTAIDQAAGAPSATPDAMPRNTATSASASDRFIRSQLGLVLFEEQLFRNAGCTLQDLEISTAAVAGDEYAEEAWLDENATPLLINRYNGTLVKGQ